MQFLRPIVRGVIGIAVLCVAGLPASATEFTLEDENSVVRIETESQAGVLEWTVDGVNQLNQQWFWYRFGDMAEIGFESLTIASETAFDTNGSGDPNTLFVEFEGCNAFTCFLVEVVWELTGGASGSGESELFESIVFGEVCGFEGCVGLNDLHLFQYSDFDLSGTADDDTVELVGPETWEQSDLSSTFSETVVDEPEPDHFEAAVVDNLLVALNDGAATTLADAAGPIGPDNVSWAFEWILNVPPGELVEIAKTKTIYGIVCGDGVAEGGEACDDGYTDECGTCNSDCTGPGAGSECGDGVVCPETETCDDGYADDCGTCNGDCSGAGTPPTCGDGLFCPETEECDDGNNDDNDGCDAECVLEGACCNFDGTCTDFVGRDECEAGVNHIWFRDRLCQFLDPGCATIPTVSEWGLVIMTLLGCTVGTLLFRVRTEPRRTRADSAKS